jgi:hypothetical protein
VTVMAARAFRYYVEGILAVFYGRRVLLFLRDNGLVIVVIFGAAAIVFVLVYALVNRSQPPIASAKPTDLQTPGTDDKALPE